MSGPDGTGVGGTRSVRDLRLDVLRGLALISIFINHTPGTIYENITTRNFGFSDAAEGFVLMSGIAAGLAYGKFFAGPGPYWPGVGKMWRRVWALYQVHIVTTMIAIALSAGFAYWGGYFPLMQRNAVTALHKFPLQALVGIPLLSHQLGYANILPLYAALLFAGPVMLWCAHRAPRLLLVASVLVYGVAAQWWINIPSFPNKGGWFFNPLTWQLLFIIGLLTGLAIKRGERLVPVRRWLIAVCLVFMAISALVALNLPVAGKHSQEWFGRGMWHVQEALHTPWFVLGFDKTYLTMPRLLHALALAYVLSCWPWLRRACASRFAAPFALLGRNGLAVFGLGVVLCYTCNGIKTISPPSLALDTALIGGGIALMLAFAWSKEAWRRAEARTEGRPVSRAE